MIRFVFTLVVLFLGTLVHSTLGFGSALLAMPILALTLGIRTATPLVALVMVTTIVLVLRGSWRHVDIRAAVQLLISSVAGIPPGLLLLRLAPENFVKGILGVVLIGFSLYGLIRPRLMMLERRAWAYLFGFAAGILGVAYNTNGPPIVIYGTLRRWPPERFRGTLQGFFLPAAVMICAAHALSGMWTREIWKLYLWSLAPVVVAFLIGSALSRRISAERFTRILYVSAGALGLMLFL